jgi:uncharacterized membrane protein YdbT with pleckstrin-like domain
MSYIQSHLVPGETVIYQTRLHWIVMIGHLIVGSLLDLTGAYLLYYGNSQKGVDQTMLSGVEWGAVALMVGGALTVLMGMLRRNATEMALTNRRVVIKKGLAGRTTIEMLLNKIETIEVSETVLGRTLGYGTIVVIGTGGTPEPFSQISHPLEFRSRVQQQIESLK